MRLLTFVLTSLTVLAVPGTALAAEPTDGGPLETVRYWTRCIAALISMHPCTDVEAPDAAECVIEGAQRVPELLVGGTPLGPVAC